MKEGVERRRKRNRMRGADDADSDGIDDRSGAGCKRPVKRRAIPGCARDLDESAALARCLQLSLAGRHEGRREFGRLLQRAQIVRLDASMSLRQKRGIAKAGAVGQHRGEPAFQRRSVGDVLRLDRPFDAAGIGEAADREGRRQPGHQPVQRRKLGVRHPAECVAARRLICGHEHGYGRDDRGRHDRHGGDDDRDHDHDRGHVHDHDRCDRAAHAHARAPGRHRRHLRDRTAPRSRRRARRVPSPSPR